MSQPRDDRQDDLFGPSLEKIINLRHPLVRLAAEIDRDFLAGSFGSVFCVGPGPNTPADAISGRPIHSQTYAQPFRRYMPAEVMCMRARASVGHSASVRLLTS